MDILSCGCGGKACHVQKLQQHQGQTVADVMMNVTSWPVSLMSVLLCKAKLMAAHDFNLSFKVALMIIMVILSAISPEST